MFDHIPKYYHDNRIEKTTTWRCSSYILKMVIFQLAMLVYWRVPFFVHPWKLTGPWKLMVGKRSFFLKWFLFLVKCWFTTGGYILLIDKILHQLRLVVYPIIYKVSYIPGGAGFRPSTVSLAPPLSWSLLWHPLSPWTCKLIETKERSARSLASKKKTVGETSVVTWLARWKNSTNDMYIDLWAYHWKWMNMRDFKLHLCPMSRHVYQGIARNSLLLVHRGTRRCAQDQATGTYLRKHPGKTNTTMEHQPFESMYLLFKMVIFQDFPLSY